MTFCLPDGYQRNLDPAVFPDDPQGVEWQPDVLPYAADLARLAGTDTIVDIGCGQARKLIPLAGEFNVIGIDLPDTINKLPSVDGATWVAVDLAARALPKSCIVPGSVAVCSDVIEHIVDLSKLRTRFRQILRASACLIVSTPDRGRYHPDGHMGPPANLAHVCEWTLDELVELLSSWGFRIAHAGHTRSNDGSPYEFTSLVVIEEAK